jgi:hypothetical protein
MVVNILPMSHLGCQWHLWLAFTRFGTCFITDDKKGTLLAPDANWLRPTLAQIRHDQKLGVTKCCMGSIFLSIAKVYLH